MHIFVRLQQYLPLKIVAKTPPRTWMWRIPTAEIATVEASHLAASSKGTKPMPPWSKQKNSKDVRAAANTSLSFLFENEYNADVLTQKSL